MFFIYMRGIKYMSEALALMSIFEKYQRNDGETDTLTLSSIFGKTQKQDPQKVKAVEYNELLKTINYITIQNHRKNQTNVLKRYSANELCMKALHETANYNFNSVGSKINIKK